MKIDADKKTVFEVDGKPFIAIAGETHNSSSSSAEFMESVWDAAVRLGLNTVLLPVTWELLEPVEDTFDFTLIDELILQARERDMHIIFLWFGSWKNAQCLYAPEWVKTDTNRFERAQIIKGKKKVYIKDFYNIPYTSLSYLCEENMRADAKTFSKLMSHLKTVDERAHTVIGVQVENETGIQGAKREHSDLADQLFEDVVPENFAIYMGKTKGQTWEKTFGRDAEETFSAFYIASYVEYVAKAGKTEYNLPLMVNAWLEQGEAGLYPSGGPIAKMMEVWKYAAPSIDVFAPDIYVRNFTQICEEYSKLGNKLVIPETAIHSHCAPRLIYTIGHHHASCFAPFGFEDMGEPFTNAQGALFGMDVTDPLLEKPQNVDEYRFCAKTLKSMMKLLVDRYGTNRLQAVISENLNGPIKLSFEEFGFEIEMFCDEVTREDGVCLVMEEEKDTFFLIVNGCRITPFSRNNQKDNCDFLYMEEGSFQDGEWKRRRRLNGDEIFSPVYNQFTLLKIKLFAY